MFTNTNFDSGAGDVRAAPPDPLELMLAETLLLLRVTGRAAAYYSWWGSDADG